MNPSVYSEFIIFNKFLDLKSGFHFDDKWYPTWASNDTFYSQWTDEVSRRGYGWDLL